MSDLDRAVQAEIDGYRPVLTPSFQGLQARRRSFARRAVARSAAALSALAVAVAVAVPHVLSLTTGSPPPAVPAAAPSGRSTDGTTSSPCSATALGAADRRRLLIYTAVLGSFLDARPDPDRPRRYLVERPVEATTAAIAVPGHFSAALLDCLRTGSDDLPAMRPVAGLRDPQLPSRGGRRRSLKPQLTDGRLVSLSSIAATDAETVKVFVSLDSGGGDGYEGQRVRVSRDAQGRWSVTRVLLDVIT